METNLIEVNPVRRLFCGVQEMLELEAVTTIVRIWGSRAGAAADCSDVGHRAQHGAARYLAAGGPVAYRQPACQRAG